MHLKRKVHLMIVPPPKLPGINTYRLNAIRTRLDDDNYTVNVEQLTSKLIDMELALIGAAKKQVA